MIQAFEVLNLKCAGCANTITKSLNINFNDIEIEIEKNCNRGYSKCSR